MFRFREAIQQVSMAIVSCDVLVLCEILNMPQSLLLVFGDQPRRSSHTRT